MFDFGFLRIAAEEGGAGLLARAGLAASDWPEPRVAIFIILNLYY